MAVDNESSDRGHQQTVSQELVQPLSVKLAEVAAVVEDCTSTATIVDCTAGNNSSCTSDDTSLVSLPSCSTSSCAVESVSVDKLPNEVISQVLATTSAPVVLTATGDENDSDISSNSNNNNNNVKCKQTTSSMLDVAEKKTVESLFCDIDNANNTISDSSLTESTTKNLNETDNVIGNSDCLSVGPKSSFPSLLLSALYSSASSSDSLMPEVEEKSKDTTSTILMGDKESDLNISNNLLINSSKNEYCEKYLKNDSDSSNVILPESAEVIGESINKIYKGSEVSGYSIADNVKDCFDSIEVILSEIENNDKEKDDKDLCLEKQDDEADHQSVVDISENHSNSFESNSMIKDNFIGVTLLTESKGNDSNSDCYNSESSGGDTIKVEIQDEIKNEEVQVENKFVVNNHISDDDMHDRNGNDISNIINENPSIQSSSKAGYKEDMSDLKSEDFSDCDESESLGTTQEHDRIDSNDCSTLPRETSNNDNNVLSIDRFSDKISEEVKVDEPESNSQNVPDCVKLETLLIEDRYGINVSDSSDVPQEMSNNDEHASNTVSNNFLVISDVISEAVKEDKCDIKPEGCSGDNVLETSEVIVEDKETDANILSAAPQDTSNDVACIFSSTLNNDMTMSLKRNSDVVELSDKIIPGECVQHISVNEQNDNANPIVSSDDVKESDATVSNSSVILSNSDNDYDVRHFNSSNFSSTRLSDLNEAISEGNKSVLLSELKDEIKEPSSNISQICDDNENNNCNKNDVELIKTEETDSSNSIPKTAFFSSEINSENNSKCNMYNNNGDSDKEQLGELGSLGNSACQSIVDNVNINSGTTSTGPLSCKDNETNDEELLPVDDKPENNVNLVKPLCMLQTTSDINLCNSDKNGDMSYLSQSVETESSLIENNGRNILDSQEVVCVEFENYPETKKPVKDCSITEENPHDSNISKRNNLMNKDNILKPTEDSDAKGGISDLSEDLSVRLDGCSLGSVCNVDNSNNDTSSSKGSDINDKYQNDTADAENTAKSEKIGSVMDDSIDLAVDKLSMGLSIPIESDSNICSSKNSDISKRKTKRTVTTKTKSTDTNNTRRVMRCGCAAGMKKQPLTQKNKNFILPNTNKVQTVAKDYHKLSHTPQHTNKVDFKNTCSSVVQESAVHSKSKKSKSTKICSSILKEDKGVQAANFNDFSVSLPQFSSLQSVNNMYSRVPSTSLEKQVDKDDKCSKVSEAVKFFFQDYANMDKFITPSFPCSSQSDQLKQVDCKNKNSIPLDSSKTQNSDITNIQCSDNLVMSSSESDKNNRADSPDITVISEKLTNSCVNQQNHSSSLSCKMPKLPIPITFVPESLIDSAMRTMPPLLPKLPIYMVDSSMMTLNATNSDSKSNTDHSNSQTSTKSAGCGSQLNGASENESGNNAVASCTANDKASGNCSDSGTLVSNKNIKTHRRRQRRRHSVGGNDNHKDFMNLQSQALTKVTSGHVTTSTNMVCSSSVDVSAINSAPNMPANTVQSGICNSSSNTVTNSTVTESTKTDDLLHLQSYVHSKMMDAKNRKRSNSSSSSRSRVQRRGKKLQNVLNKLHRAIDAHVLTKTGPRVTTNDDSILQNLLMAKDSKAFMRKATTPPLGISCTTTSSALSASVPKSSVLKVVETTPSQPNNNKVTTFRIPSALTIIPQSAKCDAKAKITEASIQSVPESVSQSLGDSVVNRLKKLGTIIEVEREPTNTSTFSDNSSIALSSTSTMTSNTLVQTCPPCNTSPAPIPICVPTRPPILPMPSLPLPPPLIPLVRMSTTGQQTDSFCSRISTTGDNTNHSIIPVLRPFPPLSSMGPPGLAPVSASSSTAPSPNTVTAECIKILDNLDQSKLNSVKTNMNDSSNSPIQCSSSTAVPQLKPVKEQPPIIVTSTTSTVSSTTSVISSNITVTTTSTLSTSTTCVASEQAVACSATASASLSCSQSIESANKAASSSKHNSQPPALDSVQNKIKSSKLEPKFVFQIDKAQVLTLPGNQRMLTCDICDGVYHKTMSLKRHYLRTHINKKYLSESDQIMCGMIRLKGGEPAPPKKITKVFIGDLSNWVNISMPGLFRCLTCGACFNQNIELKTHLMEHPPVSLMKFKEGKLETFMCSGCSKTFPRKKSFMQHRKECDQRSSAAIMDQHCLYCDKSFLSISSRNQHHLKMHHPKRKHQPCIICKTAKFRDTSTLFKHMCLQHKDKYHGCINCKLRFGSPSELTGHNKEKHKSKKSDDKDVSDDCENGEDAENKKEENVQLKTLKEKDSNKCSLCGKAFRNALNVSRHFRLAHGKHPRRKNHKPIEQQAKADTTKKVDAEPELKSKKEEKKVETKKKEKTPDPPQRVRTPPTTSEQPAPAMDPETLFYSRITMNIRENLLHHIDGKLDSQEVLEFDLNKVSAGNSSNRLSKSSKLMNFSASFTSSQDSLISQELEPLCKQNLNQNSPKAQSWEKFTFPKNYDGRCGLTSYIKDMSHLDISTQLTMRRNLQRFHSPTETSSSADVLSDIPTGLSLIGSTNGAEACRASYRERNDIADLESDLTGEWTRPRSYVCAVCSLSSTSLWELEDHKMALHPNVWCPHHEVLAEHTTCWQWVYAPRILSTSSGVLKTEPVSSKSDVALQHLNCGSCTKCKKHYNNQSELHRHMLDCGGDTTWMSTMLAVSSPGGTRRNRSRWRPFGSRRRRQQGRRGLKRNIPNTPTKQPNIRVRTKPGDTESIQKMIANLPPKRITRRIIGDDGEIKTRSQGTLNSMNAFTSTSIVRPKPMLGKVVKKTELMKHGGKVAVFGKYHKEGRNMTIDNNKKDKTAHKSVSKTGATGKKAQIETKKGAESPSPVKIRIEETDVTTGIVSADLSTDIKPKNNDDMNVTLKNEEYTSMSSEMLSTDGIKGDVKTKPDDVVKDVPILTVSERAALELKDESEIMKNIITKNKSGVDNTVNLRTLKTNDGKEKMIKSGIGSKGNDTSKIIAAMKATLLDSPIMSGNKLSLAGKTQETKINNLLAKQQQSVTSSNRGRKPSVSPEKKKQESPEKKRREKELNDDSKNGEQNNLIICDGCGMQFDSSSACQRHMKKCVYRKEEKLSSMVDSAAATSSGEMVVMKDYQVAIKNGAGKHICKHCDKVFTSFDELTDHKCDSIKTEDRAMPRLIREEPYIPQTIVPVESTEEIPVLSPEEVRRNSITGNDSNTFYHTNVRTEQSLRSECYDSECFQNCDNSMDRDYNYRLNKAKALYAKRKALMDSIVATIFEVSKESFVPENCASDKLNKEIPVFSSHVELQKDNNKQNNYTENVIDISEDNLNVFQFDVNSDSKTKLEDNNKRIIKRKASLESIEDTIFQVSKEAYSLDYYSTSIQWTPKAILCKCVQAPIKKVIKTAVTMTKKLPVEVRNLATQTTDDEADVCDTDVIAVEAIVNKGSTIISNVYSQEIGAESSSGNIVSDMPAAKSCYVPDVDLNVLVKSDMEKKVKADELSSFVLQTAEREGTMVTRAVKRKRKLKRLKKYGMVKQRRKSLVSAKDAERKFKRSTALEILLKENKLMAESRKPVKYIEKRLNASPVRGSVRIGKKRKITVPIRYKEEDEIYDIKSDEDVDGGSIEGVSSSETKSKGELINEEGKEERRYNDKKDVYPTPFDDVQSIADAATFAKDSVERSVVKQKKTIKRKINKSPTASQVKANAEFSESDESECSRSLENIRVTSGNKLLMKNRNTRSPPYKRIRLLQKKEQPLPSVLVATSGSRRKTFNVLNRWDMTRPSCSNGKVYCEPCNKEVKEGGMAKHEQSSLHIKNIDLKHGFDTMFPDAYKFITYCEECCWNFPTPFTCYKHFLNKHEGDLQRVIEQAIHCGKSENKDSKLNSESDREIKIEVNVDEPSKIPDSIYLCNLTLRDSKNYTLQENVDPVNATETDGVRIKKEIVENSFNDNMTEVNSEQDQTEEIRSSISGAVLPTKAAQFQKEIAVKAQVKAEPSTSKLQSCVDCNKDVNVDQMQKHMESKLHKKNMNLRKEFDIKFSNIKQKESFPVFCDKCSRNFNTPFLLYKHFIWKHAGAISELFENALANDRTGIVKITKVSDVSVTKAEDCEKDVELVESSEMLSGNNSDLMKSSHESKHESEIIHGVDKHELLKNAEKHYLHCKICCKRIKYNFIDKHINSSMHKNKLECSNISGSAFLSVDCDRCSVINGCCFLCDDHIDLTKDGSMLSKTFFNKKRKKKKMMSCRLSQLNDYGKHVEVEDKVTVNSCVKNKVINHSKIITKKKKLKFSKKIIDKLNAASHSAPNKFSSSEQKSQVEEEGMGGIEMCMDIMTKVDSNKRRKKGLKFNRFVRNKWKVSVVDRGVAIPPVVSGSVNSSQVESQNNVEGYMKTFMSSSNSKAVRDETTESFSSLPIVASGLNTLECGATSPTVVTALDSGKNTPDINAGSGSEFYCLLCQKQFGSAVLLVEHQSSSSHRLNESMNRRPSRGALHRMSKEAAAAALGIKTESLSSCGSYNNGCNSPSLINDLRQALTLAAQNSITGSKSLQTPNLLPNCDEWIDSNCSRNTPLLSTLPENTTLEQKINTDAGICENLNRVQQYDWSSSSSPSHQQQQDWVMVGDGAGFGMSTQWVDPINDFRTPLGGTASQFWDQSDSSGGLMSMVGCSSSLGSILDSVNKILADPDVSMIPQYSLAELQSAMGASDEEMMMLQQLGQSSLRDDGFFYEVEHSSRELNRPNISTSAEVGVSEESSTTLIDLDNQQPSFPPHLDSKQPELQERQNLETNAAVITGVENNSSNQGKAKSAAAVSVNNIYRSKIKTEPYDLSDMPDKAGSNSASPGCRGLGRPKRHLSDYESREMVCPSCCKHFLGLSALQTHLNWAHCSSHNNNNGNTAARSTNLWLRRRALLNKSDEEASRSRSVCVICKEILDCPSALEKHISSHCAKKDSPNQSQGGGSTGSDNSSDGAEKLKSKMSSVLGNLLDRALTNLLVKSQSQSSNNDSSSTTEKKKTGSGQEISNSTLQLLSKLCAIRKRAEMVENKTVLQQVQQPDSKNEASKNYSSVLANELRQILSPQGKLNNKKDVLSNAPSPATESTTLNHLTVGFAEGQEKQPFARPARDDRFLVPSIRNRHSKCGRKYRKNKASTRSMCCDGCKDSEGAGDPEIIDLSIGGDDLEQDWRDVASPIYDSDIEDDTKDNQNKNKIKPLCSDCGLRFATVKEIVSHRTEFHPSFSILDKPTSNVIQGEIKQENKINKGEIKSCRTSLPVSENVIDSTTSSEEKQDDDDNDNKYYSFNKMESTKKQNQNVKQQTNKRKKVESASCSSSSSSSITGRITRNQKNRGITTQQKNVRNRTCKYKSKEEESDRNDSNEEKEEEFEGTEKQKKYPKRQTSSKAFKKIVNDSGDEEYAKVKKSKTVKKVKEQIIEGKLRSKAGKRTKRGINLNLDSDSYIDDDDLDDVCDCEEQLDIRKKSRCHLLSEADVIVKAEAALRELNVPKKGRLASAAKSSRKMRHKPITAIKSETFSEKQAFLPFQNEDKMNTGQTNLIVAVSKVRLVSTIENKLTSSNDSRSCSPAGSINVTSSRSHTSVKSNVKNSVIDNNLNKNSDIYDFDDEDDEVIAALCSKASKNRKISNSQQQQRTTVNNDKDNVDEEKWSFFSENCETKSDSLTPSSSAST